MTIDKLNFSEADFSEFYNTERLDEKQIKKDPLSLFDDWMKTAIEKKVLQPNAMTLATADENGKPSARIVLLKDFDERGFVFFSNYQSIKGNQLSKNPNAALVFWWGKLARQVRIEGIVQKVSAAESDEYFMSRTRGKKLSALVSKQSAPITDFSQLTKQIAELEKKFADKEIARPDYWGGYRVKPVMIEFWQGRENRLHDRLRFTKTPKGNWKLERLSP